MKDCRLGYSEERRTVTLRNFGTFLTVDAAYNYREDLNVQQHGVERRQITRKTKTNNIKADGVNSNHLAL